jgi:exosortase
MACGYLLFITTNAQISLGYWLAFLCVCLASLPMIYRFNWQIIFPAAFLIFIFPFWGVLTPILQDISVVAVTFIMGFTGVPTYVQGQFITIPAGVFEIAGGCSGLRYLIVSLVISSLFIFLYIKNAKHALMFFIVAILGALLTNWIRITALILIGQYTNMESSLMEDHNTFGWYLYIPFMFLLFRWGNHLADNDLLAPTNKVNQVNTPIAMPNKVAVVTLIGLLTITSTTLKVTTSQSIMADEVANSTLVFKEENEDNIKPNIHYYSSVEKIKAPHATIGSQHYIFHFNGSDLDGKPSFYNNDFIPHGWQITEQTLVNGWQVFSVYKNQRNGQVFVKYEIAGQTVPQVTTFKMRRLVASLKGENTTSLHWKFYLCDKPCHRESL